MCNIWVLLSLAASYLLGSVPVAYIISRALKGIDIRQHGSGNVGATNVFRVVGPAAGVTVFILDMLKGFIPVTIFADFALHSETSIDMTLLRMLIGVVCICGHNWTIFLGFKGGKGMATSAGVILGLSLKIPALGMIMGLCVLIWILVFLISGYVSLASIIAAFGLPLLMIVFNQPFKLVIFGVVLCLFAVYRHKSNIKRMLQGEERRNFYKK
ncbi:MAG: glycerol-3-phosphate 1-O-acyltransferase PlsY [Candidatus Omnitrophota bacterium]